MVTMNKYEPPNLTSSPKGRKTVALVAWRHGCAAAALAREGFDVEPSTSDCLIAAVDRLAVEVAKPN